MKLKQKITIAAVLLCAVPLLVSFILTNSIASRESKEALQEAAQKQLESLRYAKKREVEDYFGTIRNQLLSMSNSDLIAAAVGDFARASKTYAVETSQLERNDIKNTLMTYYDDDFSQRYIEKNAGTLNMDSSALLDHLDINALALQNTFIALNPASLGEKDSLIKTMMALNMVSFMLNITLFCLISSIVLAFMTYFWSRLKQAILSTLSLKS